MKDHVQTKIAGPEIATRDDARESGERVWLAPALPRSIEPLLAGLGIELLAPADRERATIRVETLGREGLRIDRARSEGQNTQERQDTGETRNTNDAVEFEGPVVWAAASYVVSHAFGLSPPLVTTDAAMFAVIRSGPEYSVSTTSAH
jgi:hypothetical protein